MALGGLVDRVVVGDLELGEVGLDVEVPDFKVAAVVIRIVVGGNVVVPLVESLVDVVVLCVDDVVVEGILALGGCLRERCGPCSRCCRSCCELLRFRCIRSRRLHDNSSWGKRGRSGDDGRGRLAGLRVVVVGLGSVGLGVDVDGLGMGLGVDVIAVDLESLGADVAVDPVDLGTDVVGVGLVG